MKVAVIGAGYWGKNLVRNLHQLGALKTICDVSRELLDQFAQTYPDIATTQTLDEVLQDNELDALFVATPAETHHRVVKRTLMAGKDVFVEKPLSLRYAEGEELVELAQRQGRLLMVGHLLEYHPAVIELENLIRRGELGQMEYIYSNRLNLGRVRREENILWSFAPHDIAVILRLVGEMPIEVTATGGAYLQPNIADVTVMTMQFYNGVRSHIFVSWLHPYKEQRLVVVGSQRMAAFDDLQPTDKLFLYDQRVEWVNGQAVSHSKVGTVIPLAKQEPLRAECEHFLECVRTRRAPLTDGENGLRVLQVLEAAQRSMQTGGAPIPLHAIAGRREVNRPIKSYV